MKVLVTGARGQLGRDVCRTLAGRGIDCTGAGRDALDITDAAAVRRFLTQERPDAVIHCAAYTAVDRAEDEREACWRANADGTRFLAGACRETGAKMVYVSTDYVFPGVGTQPYRVDDPVGPLCVYGQSKLAGELAVRVLLERHFIVRTSWVFGAQGNNFVKTMLRLGKERAEVGVVCDQIGSPTYTGHLAPLLCDMILTEQYGTYHAANGGVCSWADFAEAIFRASGLPVKVNRIPSGEYPAKAKRPSNSRLDMSRLTACGFQLLPDWQTGLSAYLRDCGGPSASLR